MRLAISGLVFLLLEVSCVSDPRLPVNGYLAGKRVSTTVDSGIAQYYFGNSSPGTAPDWHGRIADIERRFSGRALGWLDLEDLAHETSPDFATLLFIREILSNPINERFQSKYRREVQRVTSKVGENNWVGIVRDRLRQYKILFIPGFRYVTDPNSGADFAGQRQLLSRLGVNVQLAMIKEEGTVEENAAIIAEIVRAESRANRKLILASTSKGGPETALALGKILSPAETSSVKAWVSVGGLIRGTFLADRVLGWPQSWIAGIAFSLHGIDPRSIRGLTTRASRARMEGIRFAPHILIVQYVGVPLSGDIDGHVRSRYRQLRKYGPNDGLTLLADESLPNGITIVEPGLDHFYRDPEIILKGLAVINIVADELGN
jgi:hypothetical protein